MGRAKDIVLSLGLSLLASTASASAWNPEQWHGELITGFVETTATEAVNEFGETVALDVYRKRTSENYGIAGLTDRWALVGAFDWQDAQIVGPSLDITFSETSKIQAGLQYQVYRNEDRAVALSVSYLEGVDLPVALLTLEGREPRIELRGLWGESFKAFDRNAFAELQLASRIETRGRYAATRGQLSVGIDPFKKAKIITKMRVVDLTDGTFEGLDIAGQQRWEVEASAIYNLFRDAYYEIGYVSTISADNAVRESGFKLSMWTKF